MICEADVADGIGMLWCIRRGWHINYLVEFSGYSRSRILRLIRIGEMLERMEGTRQ